jgi:uncharacterized protein YjdB
MLRSSRLHRAASALLVLIAGVSSGCGDGANPTGSVHGAPAGISDGRASTVQITPAVASIEEGTSTPLSCVALDSRGVVVSSSHSWTITDPSVATVGTNGTVTARQTGNSAVSCTVDGVTAMSTVSVVPSTVAFVEVTPGAGVVLVGRSIQLVATPRDSTGAALVGHQVQWSTPDSSVASVTPTGAVVAHVEGTANVIATSGGKASLAKINVSNKTPAPVAAISVKLDAASLNVGQLAHATATTLDDSGQEVTGRSITWTVQDPSVISAVSTAGNKANVTGRAQGSTVLTATSEGKSGSITVNVNMAPVQTVTVSLASPTILPGQTTQATTTLKDANGNVLSGRSLTYSSLDPNIATVTPTGVVTGVATGAVIIRATSEGKTGDASLTVGVSSVATVTVGFSTASMTPGQTAQATATSRDASGNVLTGRSVAWSTLNPSVATVSIAGVVTAVSAGAATIRATVESKTGDGTETVASTTSTGTTSYLQWGVNIASQLAVGASVPVTAVAYDATGKALTGKTITYTSSAPTVASMSPTGTLTGVAIGGTTISAAVDGKSVSTQISVIAGTTTTPTPGKVARVAVTLSRNVLVVGDSTQATAAAFDSAGVTVPGAAVTWSVPPVSATVAQVDGGGKVKSMATGSASVIATISGVAGTASLTISSTTTTAPGTTLPTSSDAAAILAHVGATIPVSQVPASLTWYEQRFKFYADSQWAVFGPRWDAGNSISAYERGATYYAWWARTGDQTYWDRAHQLVVNYRDNYLIPNNYSTSPHWSQAESLYLDCIVAKDPASCTAAVKIGYTFLGFDADIDNLQKDWLENRVQTRVLMSWWIAEKLQGKGSMWSALLDKDIPRVLAMQNTSGAWTFPISTCGTELPYMEGMLADFMTRIYDQRPGTYNPAILAAITKLGNHLWSTQWRGTANPSDPSFNYLSGLCMGTGSPTSAPDLNGLILPLFGWLGKTTGDATWFAKGDQVLNGMQGASVYLYRQFSESYSSSYRYLGYRFTP